MRSKQAFRFGPAALGLAVAILATVPADAGPGRGGPHGHGVERLERRVERLSLDEDKQAAVQEVLDAARAAEEATRQDIRDAHEAMRELLAAENPDEAAVMAQADRIGSLQLDAHKERLRTLLALRRLLTAEQWEALHERPERHGKGCDRGDF
jgi:Spy/CpxP family protein refolding chaperone